MCPAIGSYATPSAVLTHRQQAAQPFEGLGAEKLNGRLSMTMSTLNTITECQPFNAVCVLCALDQTERLKGWDLVD